MNILIIAAHPDDEALGAGAAIRKWKEQGDDITVLTMGIQSSTREKDLLTPQAESHKALGISQTENFGYEAMKFGTYDRYDMTKNIEKAIIKAKPDIVITHSPGDIHNDHRITSEIVQEAARLPIRQIGYNKHFELWFMEILSSTDWSYTTGFTPNVFVEVTDKHLEKKAEALTYYDKVLRAIPHPRNKETIYAKARLRGSACGAKYAEAFYCAYRKVR